MPETPLEYFMVAMIVMTIIAYFAIDYIDFNHNK